MATSNKVWIKPEIHRFTDDEVRALFRRLSDAEARELIRPLSDAAVRALIRRLSPAQVDSLFPERMAPKSGGSGHQTTKLRRNAWGHRAKLA